MKFGNENQIALIASEVGGSFAAAPPEAQIELFNSLIDGCREAVKMGNVDPKVGSVIVFPQHHTPPAIKEKEKEKKGPKPLILY